ncbi:MAG: DVUA0089 family protein [Nodosilinea sp.]
MQMKVGLGLPVTVALSMVMAFVAAPANGLAELYRPLGLGNSPGQTSQPRDIAQAVGAGQEQPTPVPALSPAIIIDTSSGAGALAGSVSRGVNVYTFAGNQGEQVTLNLTVTHIRRGSLYTDDDSQLFLFDGEGILLAENDDFSRLRSRIGNFTLPAAGVYYVAVTTYNNNPILSTARRIIGWQGSGGSAIDYTLTLTKQPPSPGLITP